MMEEYKVYSELTEKEQEWVLANRNGFQKIEDVLKVAARPKKEGGACANKNRVLVLEDKAKLLKNPSRSMEDDHGVIAWTEEKYLGAAITYSKVDSCDTSAANCSCREFLSGRDGFMVFGVVIQSLREVKVKKGDSAGKKMAFLSITDNTCTLSDVCAFADTYEKYSELLLEGNTVLIRGERSKQKGGMVVKEVWQI
jgi:DNA polymerase III alpha subunit